MGLCTVLATGTRPSTTSAAFLVVAVGTATTTSMNEHACEAVKSIVIATHVPYPNEVRVEMDEVRVEMLFQKSAVEANPAGSVLNIVGNGHAYCPQNTTDDALEMEFMVGEEEASDAHLVSVLAVPDDPSKHYFHFERNNVVSANCY